MSKNIVKVGQTYIAKTDDESLRKDFGEALMVTGVGGLALGGIAWLLPFVSLPMLMIAAVVFGAYIFFK